MGEDREKVSAAGYQQSAMSFQCYLKRAGIEGMPIKPKPACRQGPKVLIFPFYFLRALVTSWQNITFEMAPIYSSGAMFRKVNPYYERQ